MIRIILYALYYLVMLGAPMTLYIFFPDAGIFDLTSAVPIIIAALMVWQAYSYSKQEPRAEDEAVKERQKIYLRCLCHSYLIFAPFNFPLIFFLNAWGKSLSLIPFLGAAFAGSLFYRLREKKEKKTDTSSDES